MTIKKKAALEAYEKAFGNITQTCRAVGISRDTFYRWKNSDKAFAEKLEAIEPGETFLDFCESKLIEAINRGEVAPLLFALKTKGKDRGYVERHEVGMNIDSLKGIEIVYHEPKRAE